MNRRKLIKGMAATLPAWWLSKAFGEPLPFPDTNGIPGEKMAKGPFNPTWDSLEKKSSVQRCDPSMESEELEPRPTGRIV